MQFAGMCPFFHCILLETNLNPIFNLAMKILCITGLFDLCLYMAFHGPYNEHVLDITPVQPDNAAEIRAQHGTEIREEVRQT